MIEIMDSLMKGEPATGALCLHHLVVEATNHWPGPEGAPKGTFASHSCAKPLTSARGIRTQRADCP